jgi:hypothetical protein
MFACVIRQIVFGGGRVMGFAFFLSLASGSLATSVIAPRFEMLVDSADLIFTGQALSQRSEWRNKDGQKSIFTFVTFGVQQVHKGRASSTVTLQFMGGTIGDVTLNVAEMPKFKPGERVVLFVAENGAAVSPLIGFYHGKFSLRKDSSGRDEVLQHNGERLGQVREIGRAKGKGEPKRGLSHEEFSTRIRERVANAPKQP